jgi:two-component system, cell cycle sensor histidine kinase and response regulator CckA
MGAPAVQPSETILVVDDDPDVLSVAKDMLQGLGYTVQATDDPHAALRFARTHPEPIHLLLTDVVMPRMAGRALSEEFRILRPGAKVLFMSAFEIETVEAYRVRVTPAEPFLHKPFTLTTLERTVRAALRHRPPTSWPR